MELCLQGNTGELRAFAPGLGFIHRLNARPKAAVRTAYSISLKLRDLHQIESLDFGHQFEMSTDSSVPIADMATAPMRPFNVGQLLSGR